MLARASRLRGGSVLVLAVAEFSDVGLLVQQLPVASDIAIVAAGAGDRRPRLTTRPGSPRMRQDRGRCPGHVAGLRLWRV